MRHLPYAYVEAGAFIAACCLLGALAGALYVALRGGL